MLFPSGDAAGLYLDPVEVVTASNTEEVWPALLRVEAGVARGLTAAGFIAYEAAPAFDPALQTRPPGNVPLLWFGLYSGALPPQGAPNELPQCAWTPALNAPDYAQQVAQIRDYLAAGDAYQVNFTFPMRAAVEGDLLQMFHAIHGMQPTPLSAYLKFGAFQILSLSPELFFDLEEARIWSRPMKGTRPRGRYAEEDAALAAELRDSPKDRAENLMITDLLRNDLGRIAEPGSVTVPALFDVERYPTVWQMTSTVEARTHASVPEMFRALFPCGSVTGAPKIRAMEIIRELETEARGVYCGAIGWWKPGRRARFSVAIRTLTADSGVSHYPVGSGITWDSCAADEYDECLQKAALLQRQKPEFELLETLLFDGAYALLERHLNRMARSADYFDFPFSRDAAREALESAGPFSGPSRVRLLWSATGHARTEVYPFAPRAQPLRAAVSPLRVNSQDVYLFHKTTHRAMYADALAACPGCDDALLQNERGELTESCFGNLLVTLGGIRFTPPVTCGLLAGCQREEMIAHGEITERVLFESDLAQAEKIEFINSVQGILPVALH